MGGSGSVSLYVILFQVPTYRYPSCCASLGLKRWSTVSPQPALLRTSGNLGFDLDCSLSLSFNVSALVTMTRSLETRFLWQSSSSRAVCNYAADACKTRGLIVLCQHPGGCQRVKLKARLDGVGNAPPLLTHPE